MHARSQLKQAAKRHDRARHVAGGPKPDRLPLTCALIHTGKPEQARKQADTSAITHRIVRLRPARDHSSIHRRTKRIQLLLRDYTRCCLGSQPSCPGGHVFGVPPCTASPYSSGRRNGTSLFGFSPVMTSGRHGVLLDRSAPAGVARKPQRRRGVRLAWTLIFAGNGTSSSASPDPR